MVLAAMESKEVLDSPSWVDCKTSSGMTRLVIFWNIGPSLGSIVRLLAKELSDAIRMDVSVV